MAIHTINFKALTLLISLSSWYQLYALDHHIVRIASLGSLRSANIELEELPDARSEARSEAPSPFMVAAPEPRSFCCCELFDCLTSVQEQADNFLLYGEMATNKQLDRSEYGRGTVNQNYQRYLSRPHTLSLPERDHWASKKQQAVQKVRRREAKVILCCGSVTTAFAIALLLTKPHEKTA